MNKKLWQEYFRVTKGNSFHFNVKRNGDWHVVTPTVLYDRYNDLHDQPGLCLELDCGERIFLDTEEIRELRNLCDATLTALKGDVK